MKLNINQITGYVPNKKVAVGLVLVVLVVFILVWRSQQQPTGTAEQSIAEAQVTRGSIEVTVTDTGTVIPVTTEDIGAGVSGKVQKTYTQNGKRVKQGDLLVELVSDALNLQVTKAKLDVEKARLSINDSAGQLSADTIIAPVAGRIVNLDVKADNEVSKNTVMATVQDDSQLVFDMPVDSATATKAAINQKVQVFLPDRGESIEGKVIGKSGVATDGSNGQNRAYLKIAVTASGDLTSGMKAFGTITVAGKEMDALGVSNLAWINEAQIKATLSGNVTSVYIKEGQVVKQGQKLFALSSTANLNQQKVQQLAYQQAQLSLEELENQLADLQVKAPVDGTVSGMAVKVGDEVSGGASSKTSSASTSDGSTGASSATLGKIINSEQMEISFPVDEVEITRVKVGQTANIALDALPGQVFKGKVAEIAEEGTVTNNVASFEVTILVDNAQKLLKSGMTANVTLVVARKADTLLIPIEALQERGERKLVFIPAKGDSARQQAMQPVSVGLTNESFAEITEGLQEGDIVLMPGQQVRTTNQNSMIPGFGGGPMGGTGRRPTGSGTGGASGAGVRITGGSR